MINVLNKGRNNTSKSSGRNYMIRRTKSILLKDYLASWLRSNNGGGEEGYCLAWTIPAIAVVMAMVEWLLWEEGEGVEQWQVCFDTICHNFSL